MIECRLGVDVVAIFHAQFLKELAHFIGREISRPVESHMLDKMSDAEFLYSLLHRTDEHQKPQADALRNPFMREQGIPQTIIHSAPGYS